MKIKGIWGRFDAPYVRALLICPGLNLREHIEFFIDSGASRTTILDNDAIRLGINLEQLERSKVGTTGIGGVVDTYLIHQATLIFRTSTGIHEESFDRLFILKHKSRSKREEERIKRIPSLLGRDFINRYSLLLNKKGDIVVISDEEGIV